ncbi:cell envelope integrity protein TolA [Buttiauxella sp.]|uniref:cell envelope integrity protein TolA n=1 Tax=Buttiauxella sp. TaxID=1972222 RepID=UPI003C757D3E
MKKINFWYGYKKPLLIIIAATLSLTLTGCINHSQSPASTRGINSVSTPSSSDKTQLNANISNYAYEIKRAIEDKFDDPASYRGKACSLRINLAPDGALMSVKAEGGDPALCEAAIAATKVAHIPAPPNIEVYEVFQHAAIDFQL